MSKPMSSNLKLRNLLKAKHDNVLGKYLSKINGPEAINDNVEPPKLQIPAFKTPEIPKFDPIVVPKIEPRAEEQTNTLDDFEREYQAFIEKLKKEKEKKELKEELKAYCREYINELLGIEQEQPVEEEPPVEEPEDTVVDEPLFADVDEETTPEEPKSMEEEYQDFINSLKQRKKENNNE